MRILLSAYSCNPGKGSEPGVGWAWLRELSKRNEVWVLFYAGQGQKSAVDSATRKLDWKDNIHLVPVELAGFIARSFYRLRYELWQRRAYEIAMDLHAQIDFEIIHHVTIAAWWNCGYLWRIPVPFVFGPISGGQRIPRAFFAFLPFHSRAYEGIRDALLILARRFWRRARAALRSSAAVLAANRETVRFVEAFGTDCSIKVLTEVGVDCVEEMERAHQTPDLNQTIHLLWVGRFLPQKNFELVFRVLKTLPDDVRWDLRVAGSGALHEKYKRKVRDAGIASRVSFLGKVDWQNVATEYKHADVLLFPSLRDATGTVVVEAMSFGVVVMAINIHGAAIVLSEETGFLFPVTNPDQLISDFGRAITWCFRDPQLRYRLGANAVRYAREHLLWARRGEMMQKIYLEQTGHSNRNS